MHDTGHQTRRNRTGRCRTWAAHSHPGLYMHVCTGSASSARHRPQSIGRAPGDFQARAPAREPASRHRGPRKRDGETVQCPFKPVRRPWKLGEPQAHRGAPMGARGGTIVTICGIKTAEGAPSIENRIMA
ncbi:hypothetical protein BKA56DRAFT_338227 [Ilyonectria sp. MPI-CAGE-AT-0026]|nr:hypothetical protein BKA56DRAFT_338227 [Ilyonectria sp. MPI-CAGE-AT-0026]